MQPHATADIIEAQTVIPCVCMGSVTLKLHLLRFVVDLLHNLL